MSPLYQSLALALILLAPIAWHTRLAWLARVSLGILRLASLASDWGWRVHTYVQDRTRIETFHVGTRSFTGTPVEVRAWVQRTFTPRELTNARNLGTLKLER